MWKVLIVDDEPIIRKGLVNVINWKKFDCQVCGEAADGVDGTKKIEELQPDIIFADINMPGVDGLTMIKRTRDLVPHSKFILLTGYRDFTYMQEAIRLGAFDYILKPSKIEEISEVLMRAVMEIRLKKSGEEELKRLKDHLDKSLPLLRERFLYDVIFKVIGRDEIVEDLELHQLQLREFIVVMIEVDDNSQKKIGQYERHLYQFGIMNAFEEMFQEDFQVENVSLSIHRIACILQPHQRDQEFSQMIYKKTENLQELIKNCFDFTITAAISTIGHGIFSLADKAEECMEALEYKFYMGKSSTILYKDLQAIARGKQEVVLEEWIKPLLRYIRTGNEEEVRKVLDQIYEEINTIGPVDKETMKEFYGSVFHHINGIRVMIKQQENRNKEVVKDISGIYKAIELCEDMDTLHQLLQDTAMQIVGRIHKLNKNNIHQVLEKALLYLQENYQDSITLNDVAEEIFVSTFYLSRMFKRELGKNFVDCLNDIRIEKAKEYLQQAQYKTYEIAEMVGIRDAHYFSKLFKKHTGMTPTEYRFSYETSI